MRKCDGNGRFAFLVTLLTLIFLYAPLIVVAVASFNSSKLGGKWKGFSLIWYEKLFQDVKIWEALCNTIAIAVIATIFSTVLGTLAALVLYRSKNRFKAVFSTLVYTPLVVPDILMGIGLLLLFVMFISAFDNILKSWFGFEAGLGFTTIIIAHVTFCLSYVTMVVLGRLQEFDKSMLEAAQDLGASGFYTFVHVTLPAILPGIIAGALFAFTLSIDDFVITFFVKGAGDTTLPIFIESAMKKGRKLPLLNALSVLFIAFTFVIVFITQKILTAQKDKQK
ncbi:MAG: ABC transporter permease [Lentisphaeria bacterium]|nr:ABC transporter permease [Lentisphaeria bacterium]